MRAYKSIFEVLYYGKINPFGRKVPSNPEKEEVESKIQVEKDYFRNELSPDVYERLDRLESLYTEASDMENIDLFTHGFRIGALIMLEVLAEADTVITE